MNVSQALFWIFLLAGSAVAWWFFNRPLKQDQSRAVTDFFPEEAVTKKKPKKQRDRETKQPNPAKPKTELKKRGTVPPVHDVVSDKEELEDMEEPTALLSRVSSNGSTGVDKPIPDGDDDWEMVAAKPRSQRRGDGPEEAAYDDYDMVGGAGDGLSKKQRANRRRAEKQKEVQDLLRAQAWGGMSQEQRLKAHRASRNP